MGAALGSVNGFVKAFTCKDLTRRDAIGAIVGGAVGGALTGAFTIFRAQNLAAAGTGLKKLAHPKLVEAAVMGGNAFVGAIGGVVGQALSNWVATGDAGTLLTISTRLGISSSHWLAELLESSPPRPSRATLRLPRSSSTQAGATW